MLRSFIHKEIYQIIARRSFWVLCAVIFTLNIYTTTVQVFSDNNRKESFQEYWIEHQKFNQLKPKELNSIPFSMAILPPAKLGMLFTGLKQVIGLPPIEQNSLDYLFKNIDFGILTGILFSLLAMILSYHTISGEREEGTLKLIDSFPVKRAKIILGKWLGIVITIGCLYSLCFSVSILLLLIFANTSIAVFDLYAILFIYLIGLIYISGVVLLGIYISVKVRHSYLSLLTALLVWALVILVLPSVPDYTGRLIKSPSPLQFIHSEAKAEMTRKAEIKKIRQKYREQDMTEEEIDEKAKLDIERVIKSNNTERNKNQKEFENGLFKRLGVSLAVSFLSPYTCYTLAVNELAATGLSVNVALMQQRDMHRSLVNNYLEEIRQRSINNPLYTPDYSDMPKFQFQYPSLIVRLIAAGVPMLLLLFFNILFFVMSFKAFLKYDVR